MTHTYYHKSTLTFLFIFFLFSAQMLSADSVTTQIRTRVSVSTMDSAAASSDQKIQDTVQTDDHVPSSTEETDKNRTTKSATSPYLFITSAPQQATVTINDKESGKTPLVATPEKGICSIRLSLTGYQKYSTDIMVTPQLNDTLSVVLLSKNAHTPSAGVKKSPHRKILRYSLGGMAVVSTMAGIIANVKMRNAYDEWHSEMSNPALFDKNEKKYYQHLNNTMAGFGLGLLFSTGLVLTFVF